ncbi:MAG: hypothetical protein U5K00_11345 [Melioribacteraceae bacterium]|nr:hypothetical protein [Melioribacteraceae bacterium]
MPFGAKGSFYNELKSTAKKNKIKISELPTNKFQQLRKRQQHYKV